MRKSVIVILVLTAASLFCQSVKKDLIVKGPYLGQKPPGTTPELFAPGIISRPEYFEHSAAIFTPDGREVFWSAKANNQRNFYLYSMQMVNGIWSQPKIVDFCKESETYQQIEFALTSDGKKLYFTKDRKWFLVEKHDGLWNAPTPVSLKTISDKDAYICSITNNGSIYFIKRPEFDVSVLRVVKGGYQEPEKLGSQINLSDTRESFVYVAPDESYMIIEASKDAVKAELFVSYRLQDNSWSERFKLPIDWGRFPSVSPDGKFLFFMKRDGIYWVSSKIIEALRPKE